LPIHLFHLLIAPCHRCESCGTAFKTRANLSDYLLTLFFGLLMVLLGKLWWISLLFLWLWLIIAWKLRQRRRGEKAAHTLIAGIFLATLWNAALVVKVDGFMRFLERGGGVASVTTYTLFCLIGVCFGLLLYSLDRHFPRS